MLCKLRDGCGVPLCLDVPQCPKTASVSFLFPAKYLEWVTLKLQRRVEVRRRGHQGVGGVVVELVFFFAVARLGHITFDNQALVRLGKLGKEKTNHSLP